MDSLKAGGLPFAFSDLTKAWLNFRLPSLRSIDALREAHHKNAAALTSVNQVIFDGLKSVAQHQAEFFQSRIDDYRKVTKDVLASGSIEEGAAHQADINGRVYLSSVGHVRELSDIAVRANVSAVEILTTRVAEAFDEFKAVFAAPVRPSSGTQAEIEEHIAISEQAGPVLKLEVKPEPIVKTQSRKKVKPAAKHARRRTSRK